MCLSHLDISYTQVLHWRERKRKSIPWKLRNYSCCWGFTLSWSNSILRKFCRVFSLVVSLRKIFVFSYVFVLVFLSVILFLCYDIMMLNRSFITIKNLTNLSYLSPNANLRVGECVCKLGSAPPYLYTSCN